ncbi:MAG: ABC transporter permease [Betaproteobacteria bacterium 13_1_40CM_4_64_4]|nr:MAG: ABC transporter permease [Betaproteobacteria bacterium 13_1_40CM_4_64_4]
MDNLIPILVAAVAAGTPMVFAALGELVTEKSGVLNLGVEGMMLMGAVTGFAVASQTGNPWLGAVAGMAAGAAMALIFAVLTLNLMANQVASGLALTLFGVGLSAFLGKPYESVSLTVAPPPAIPLLSQIPVLGPMLFSYHVLVYVSWALFAAIAWFMYKSRAGLVLRSIGESPESAHAIGYPVIRIRYLATLFGGAMAGLGGAYLSEFYAPLWVEGMTAGRGWIALALVVFATWRPARVMIGAYLFGGVTIAQFFAQGAGISIASQFLSSLPYLATIVALVFISRNLATIRLNAPVSLAKSYRPD